MPKTKTNTVYARLELASHDPAFTLTDSRYEINERLYEVLNEPFYAEAFTQELVRLHPEIFAAWVEWRESYTGPRPNKIQAVGKFEVSDQKVELIDIRFN